MSTILTQMGSKAKYCKSIRSILDENNIDYSVIVEPFSGTAAFSLSHTVDVPFIINDISKYVYNKTVLNKSWKFQEAIVLQEIENTTSDIKKASKDSGYFNEDVLLEIGKAYLKTKSIQTKTFNNIPCVKRGI